MDWDTFVYRGIVRRLESEYRRKQRANRIDMAFVIGGLTFLTIIGFYIGLGVNA